MAIPGPLKDEFFKYRKSKTKLTDGSVAGISYNRYRSHLTHPLGSGNGRPPAGYHHDLYMHGNPGEYRPNINAPSVDWDDYDTYEPTGVSPVSHNTQRQIFNVSNILPSLESVPTDDLTLTEQFLQAMGKRGTVEEKISDGIIADTNRNLEQITDFSQIPDFGDLADAFAKLSKVFSQYHPDIVNLRNAMNLLSSEGLSPRNISENNQPETETFPDPFQEVEKNFNRQIELLENPANPLSQVSLFEPGIMPDALASEQLAGEQMLEDIIANEDIGLAAEPAFMENDMTNMPESVMDTMQPDEEMIADEINQAIDQVTEPPLPQEMEPDPWQMQYDQFSQMAQMFDPHYMMPPGLGPMDMGFGPMGPM